LGNLKATAPAFTMTSSSGSLEGRGAITTYVYAKNPMALVKLQKSHCSLELLEGCGEAGCHYENPIARREGGASQVEKVAERVAAPTEQLASGLTQASAAAAGYQGGYRHKRMRHGQP